MIPRSPEEIAAIIYCGAFAVALAGVLVFSLLWSALAVLAQSGRVHGDPVPDYDKLGRAALKQDAVRKSNVVNLRKWE